MKYLKTTVAAMFVSLLLIATTTTASAKNKCVPVIYAYGFAASFNDSTVYFTEIQELKNVWLNSKNNFLIQRENYSNQFRDYLAGQGKTNRTCIISYALKRSDIEKRFVKMKRKYVNMANYDIKYVNPSEFRFQVFEVDPEMEEKPLTKAERKAQKKAAKDAVKKQKEQAKAKKKETKAAEKQVKDKQKTAE